jgi:hypothetical protein
MEAGTSDPGPSSSLSPGPPARFPSASDRAHGQPANEPPFSKKQAGSGLMFCLAMARQNIWLDWIKAKQGGGSRTACLAVR